MQCLMDQQPVLLCNLSIIYAGLDIIIADQFLSRIRILCWNTSKILEYEYDDRKYKFDDGI